ncbi:MAG: dTDP-4-dehydrorhamnose 3,5-epimerase [Candidatus Competibacteraceae bacterium]|nr:dTDP-4-dehydrorhamnose 3,5-epimerase [Candidatus Competibacteraceae bacterium]
MADAGTEAVLSLVVQRTVLSGVVVLTPRRFGDERGFFAETYNRRRLAEATGQDWNFIQDNLSLSALPGTVRGLHFQTPPFDQVKLVSVLKGAVLDVAVDIRRGSPTYGRHAAVRLSAAEGNQLLVPVGFAHGFCTLEPDTLVAYKVTNYYSPEHDRGLLWSDDSLGIAWPVTKEGATLSAKDRVLPPLSEIDSPFRFRPTDLSETK